MPDPLPNVPDLIVSFAPGTDPHALASAFLEPDLETSRRVMRDLVTGWEREAAS